MVLKKSNSPFNTGATQRINDGGVWIPQYKSLSSQFITLDSPDWRMAIIGMSKHEALRSAENLIYSYLTLTEGEFPSFIRIERRENAEYMHKYLSLTKNKLWMLPDRFETMMRDTTFTKKVSRLVDLHLSLVELQRGRTRPFWSKPYKHTTWNAQSELKQGDDNNEEFEIVKPSRREHTRGIQRPAMWARETPNRSRERFTSAERPAESKPRLQVTLHDTRHVDSRCANIFRPEKRFSILLDTIPKRSSRKRKGFKRNALYALSEEIREGLKEHDVEEEYTLFHEYDDLHFNVKCLQKDCDTDTSLGTEFGVDGTSDEAWPSHLCKYSLSEFCSTQGRRHKRKSKKVVKINGILNFEQSTKGFIRYISKEEAFSFLSQKEECQLQDSVMDVSNDIENTENFKQDQGFPDKNIDRLSIEDITALDQVRQNQMCDHDNKFVPVYINNCVMCSESGISINVNARHKRCCYVQRGNSCPGHFVIDLGHIISDDVQCHLVAKRTPERNMWLVALFSNDSPTTDDYTGITDHFKSLIGRLEPREWDIEYISQLAMDTLLHFHKDLPCNITPTPSHTERLKVPMVMSPAWANLSHCLPGYECHVESKSQAIASLVSDHSQVPASEPLSPQHQDIEEIGECAICDVSFHEESEITGLTLIACGHTFCVSCWRSHIFHAIRSGHCRIFCMELKCQNEVNEALVMAMVPYALTCSWRELVRNRILEASAAHTWCPNVRCDKVASIGGLHPKSNYGQPVVCDCGHIWCHSCQSIPHWPASCGQAAAYRKMITGTSSLDRLILSVATMEVIVKKCPKCIYPALKIKKCSCTNCPMCDAVYCWDCLKLYSNHNDAQCPSKPKEDTYVLKNILVVEHPVVSYLEKCMKHRNNCQDMSSPRVISWLVKLKRKALGCPYLLKGRFSLENRSPVDISILAQDCLSFLKSSHTLLEHMYILLGFARRSSKCSRLLVLSTEHLLDQLEFIASRVEVRAVHKSFLTVLKAEGRLRTLLDMGDRYVKILTHIAPRLQVMAEDVETTWAKTDDLNLRKHNIRYI